MKNEQTDPMQNMSPNRIFILKLDQYTQTNLEDDCLTLADYVAKYSINNIPNIPANDEAEVDKTNEQNKTGLCVESADQGNGDICDNKVTSKLASEVVNEVVKIEVKNTIPAKPMSALLNRPKKFVNLIKDVPKAAPTATIKPKAAPTNYVKKSLTTLQLPIMKKQAIPFRNNKSVTNLNAKENGPTNRTTTNRSIFSNNSNVNQKSNGCTFGSSRFPTRSKTMIEVRTNRKPVPNNTALGNRQWVDEIDSSSSTLKASNDKLETRKNNSNPEPHYSKPLIRTVDSRKSEPKQMINSDSTDDGWLTVKNRRRSSLHWASRFNQPSASASLPTLSVIEDIPQSEPKELADSKLVKDSKNIATKKKVIAIGKTDTLQNCSHNPRNTKSNIVTKKTDRPPTSVESKKLFQPLSERMVDLEKSNKTTNKRSIKSAQGTATDTPIDLSKSSSTINKRTIKTAQVISSELDKAKLVNGEVEKSLKTSNNRNINISHSAPTSVDDKKSLKSESVIDLENKKNLNAQSLIVKCQRTELTGLNMKSLRKEYLRSDKYINAIVSETVNKPSWIDMNGDDKSTVLQKVDMNIQTNILSSTIGELYNTCYNGEKNTDISSCDELEEKDDTESDEDQRKLLEEQESLERQIRELENTGNFIKI